MYYEKLEQMVKDLLIHEEESKKLFRYIRKQNINIRKCDVSELS